jgi:histidyl-tRNA synthetase
VLVRLGFTDFKIRVNHRQVLSALLTNALVGADRQAMVLVELDKLDKVGLDGVARGLADRGIAPETITRLRNWIRADYPPDWLDWLERDFSVLTDQERAAFANLREIFSLAASTSAAGYLKFDPSLARGLSYYTGAIMEVAVPDLAGSLGGGGRYDGLIGMFGSEQIPACGFSLGLERILVVMGERNMFPPDVDAAAADVLVTLFDAASVPDSLKLAAELRACGYRVDVYPEPDKLGKQFKYAAAAGVPKVAVLGADERANGVVTIKDMKTGEQKQISRTTLSRETID